MFDQLKTILVEDLQMRTEDVVATADSGRQYRAYYRFT